MNIATVTRARSTSRWLPGWRILGVLGLALVAAGGGPGEQESRSALQADLARVAPDAFLAQAVQIDAFWNSEAVKNLGKKAPSGLPDLAQDFEKFTGVALTSVERVTLVVPGVLENNEPIFLVRTKTAFEKERVLKTALPERTEENTDQGTIYIGKDRRAFTFLDDRVFVFGTPSSVQKFLERPAPMKEGPLTPFLRLAAQGKHAVTAGINTKPLQVLRDKLPADAELFKPLLAATSALLTVDLTDKLNYELRSTFANAKDAENAEKAVDRLRQLAIGLLGKAIEKSATEGKDADGDTQLFKFAEASVKAVKVERKDAVLHASLSVNPDEALTSLVESVRKIREAAQRIKSSNNLKQIVLAMLNYHDANGRFPAAAIFDKNAKPLLSWRVTILPYLEEEALYKEFHLDEPWDSTHNKKLVEKMPPVYLLPGDNPKKPLTRYQVFVGKGAFFEGALGLRIRDIKDGLSNTIMVIEAPKGVPWTKPEDLSFDDGKLVPRVVDPKRKGFMAALGDGSVRFFKKTIKEKTLRLLVQRDDGMPIPDDDE